MSSKKNKNRPPMSIVPPNSEHHEEPISQSIEVTKRPLEEVKTILASSGIKLLMTLAEYELLTDPAHGQTLWLCALADAVEKNKLPEGKRLTPTELQLEMEGSNILPPHDALFNFQVNRPSIFRQKEVVHVEGLTFPKGELTSKTAPFLWFQQLADMKLLTCFQPWIKFLDNLTGHMHSFQLLATTHSFTMPTSDEELQNMMRSSTNYSN